MKETLGDAWLTMNAIGSAPARSSRFDPRSKRRERAYSAYYFSKAAESY